MKKRLLAILLAAVMVMGLAGFTGNKALAEAKNFNEEGYPIVNEKITLKVLLGVRDSDTIIDPKDMPALQRLEEQTGIHVEWDVVKSADWDTKLSLMWASEEYPDVILASNQSVNVEDYGVSQGLLIPLDELSKKYMPNYTERIALEKSDPTVSLIASDGKKYSIGRAMHYGNQCNQHFFINQGWLDALKLETPKDVGELTDVLRAFVSQDPNGNGEKDEVGIEMGINGFYGVRFVLPLFGVPCDSSLWIYLDENKQVQFTPYHEGFRKCMEWLHTMYEEGILSAEVLSQDSATVENKLKSNSVGFFTAWRLANMGFDNGVEKDSVLWSPEGACMHRILNVAAGSAYVTETNKNVEATMRWLDALMETEMMFSLVYGEKDATDGTGWKWDDNGKVTLLNDYSINEKTYLDVNTLYWMPSTYYMNVANLSKSYAQKQEFCAVYEEHGIFQPYSNDYIRLAPLTSDQKADANLIGVDINSAVVENIARFIEKGVTDESWASFMKIFEQIDVTGYMKTYQDALNTMDIQ